METPTRKKVLGVSEEDLGEIAHALANENELIAKNDVAGLLALYTEDAVVLTDVGSAQGKEAIKRLYEHWFSAYDYWSLNRTILEVVGMGDVVAELGTYTGNAHPKGQKATEIKGKYIFMWKRATEGWRIHWEVELEEHLVDTSINEAL